MNEKIPLAPPNPFDVAKTVSAARKE
jgi:hypothetical protein